MSILETSLLREHAELPPVGKPVELNDLFLLETVALLMKHLTRAQRVEAIESGADRALHAVDYLNYVEDSFAPTSYFVGEPNWPETRASHLLGYAGFNWRLSQSEGIIFDERTKSWRGTLLTPEVVELDLVSPVTPVLYEHHEYAGDFSEPSIITYSTPAIEAAKRLIAQA